MSRRTAASPTTAWTKSSAVRAGPGGSRSVQELDEPIADLLVRDDELVRRVRAIDPKQAIQSRPHNLVLDAGVARRGDPAGGPTVNLVTRESAVQHATELGFYLETRRWPRRPR